MADLQTALGAFYRIHDATKTPADVVRTFEHFRNKDPALLNRVLQSKYGADLRPVQHSSAISDLETLLLESSCSSGIVFVVELLCFALLTKRNVSQLRHKAIWMLSAVSKRKLVDG